MKASGTVRWILTVSEDIDATLRDFLARHGLREEDISRFVEEAVRWRVLDRTVAETKARNASVAPEEIEAAIDEALAEIRAERFKRSA